MELLETRTLLATSVLSTSLPTVVGTAGDALAFNGVNDYLITPNLASAYSGTSTTVEMWFKANGPGVILDELGTPVINNPSWHDSQIEITSTGQVEARVWNLSSVNLGQASFGTWNFVALRYNSASGGIEDGVLNGIASSTTVTGARSTPYPTNGLYYAFGSTDSTTVAGGTGNYFNGAIADVSIWNVARSTATIQADMAQLPTPQANLVAAYQLSDGAGMTAADSSGNNFTANLGGGTAANAPTWVTSNKPTAGVVSTATATSQAAIDHFAVEFSQPLSTTSATSASNYSLIDNNGLNYSITPS